MKMTKLVAFKEPYTRLTPNANGWVKPSGPCGKCRTDSWLFEGENAFGFEEWLFNPEHCIDGWQFGYLQAFRKEHGGVCIAELDLISRVCYREYGHPDCVQPKVQPNDGWYFVTRIRKVRGLTDQEADQVLRYASIHGWVDAMRSSLNESQRREFDRHLAMGARNIFNVMFLREESAVPELGYTSLRPLTSKPREAEFKIHPGHLGQPCPPIPHRIFG